MFNPRDQGVVKVGILAIMHIEREYPLLTYPEGTYYPGYQGDRNGIYVDDLRPTILENGLNEKAVQETLRWQTICTFPMPNRLLEALEYMGGESRLSHPEFAKLICVGLDSLKRAVAHYRALHMVSSGSRFLRLEK